MDNDQLPYDRTRTGWESRWETIEVPQPDGRIVKITGAPTPRVRSEALQERCGPYEYQGRQCWGDHRVNIPGTTCESVNCHVAHHPDTFPGWSEPNQGVGEDAREGLMPIAAALEGWDGGGLLPRPIGDTLAWIGAHIALDALRDAGYEITLKKVEGSTDE